jgi:hypothetical protein
MEGDEGLLKIPLSPIILSGLKDMQYAGWPVVQQWQVEQETKERRTLSPGLVEVTALPILSTIPAPKKALVLF